MSQLVLRKRWVHGLRGGVCFLIIGPPIGSVVYMGLSVLGDIAKHGDVSSGMAVMLLFAIVGGYIFGAVPAFVTGFLASSLYPPPGSLPIYLLVCAVCACALAGLMMFWETPLAWSAWLGVSLMTVPASLGAGATWWLFETGRL